MIVPSRKLELVNSKPEQDYLVRIAFATSDRESVNQHFGTSEAFVIYGLTTQRWQLVEVIDYPQSVRGHDDNKLKSRIGILNKCGAIYCNAIGASAIRQLLSASIQPFKVERGLEIQAILKDLSFELENNPKSWIGKILATESNAQHSDRRLTDLLNEEWDN